MRMDDFTMRFEPIRKKKPGRPQSSRRKDFSAFSASSAVFSSSTWQFDCKPCAARTVVADLDAAAVLGDDSPHDGQAEAAAAPFGRVVGQEQLLALPRRDTRTVVGDHDADHRVR